MSGRSRIAVATVLALAIAFLVVGAAAGGGNAPEPARSAVNPRLASAAELPSLAEDPAERARRAAQPR
jgi:hypothetical protein